MNIDVQDRVCEFVREIVAARTGETVKLKERPDREQRNVPAPDESWQSPTRLYAVEHTLIESFEGQNANTAKITRLLGPVKIVLGDLLPGYFVLDVDERETTAARVNFNLTHLEAATLIVEAATRMAPGDTEILRSERLPFEMRLHLRHSKSSALILGSNIDGDPTDLRLQRVRRAFTAKFPKLAAWARNGYVSALVLEANDFQHASVFRNFSAVKSALSERADQPDLIVLVETDGSPFYGWILKERDRLGDDVPTPNGRRCYTEGQIR